MTTGILLAFGAASCLGVSAFLVRLGVHSINPLTGLWISLVSGLALVFGLAFAFNAEHFGQLSLIPILWFALNGLFNFAIGRMVNYLSIHLAGVTRATPIFSTAPLFATILAIMYLGESATIWLLIGTGTIVAGVALITSDGIRR